ncbi:uncharacterized protein RJT20DRAFT_127578 [Scheffersomyces xylosifermentans]|uniref:uncharacterized protein n=1 Tax=Scheffersomyces xylosifermentans TaxID=1304137 RepID=UPI00315C7F65
MADYADRGVRLGGEERDYNHATDGEYKRLRAKADEVYKKKNSLSQKSQQAYKNGDKQRAHELSEQAKLLANEAEGYNRQAAEYVFRENNADSGPDEIDLHGLYVKEAEWILQNRIANDIRTNQSHLRVIVGKGLHSANGIAKLKPAIDEMCDQCNLKHHIDPKNTGVLVIDLTNTQSSQVPNHWNSNIQHPQQAYHGSAQPQYQQQQGGQPQYYQQQGSGNNLQGLASNPLVGTLVKIICSCLKNNV